MTKQEADRWRRVHLDLTIKGHGRANHHELCTYEVKNGKIVSGSSPPGFPFEPVSTLGKKLSVRFAVSADLFLA